MGDGGYVWEGGEFQIDGLGASTHGDDDIYIWVGFGKWQKRVWEK